MDIMHNGFKSALARGQLQVGLWLALANGYAAEVVAGAGFDWLLIDADHAPNTFGTVLSQLQALASYPLEPVVRPARNDPIEIRQLLDLGARTLLVPMIQSAEDARAAVAAMRFPPSGVRGVGSAATRASRWNGIDDYLPAANESVCTLVQLQTCQGIEAIDDICRVEGVDGIFLGPADTLAADCGYLGEPGHPAVQQLLECSLRRIHEQGKAAGVLVNEPGLASRFIECGSLFIAVGLDTTLLSLAAGNLARRYGCQPVVGMRTSACLGSAGYCRVSRDDV